MVLSAWVSETFKDGYPTASPGNKIPSNTVLGLKTNPRSWWKQTEVCTIISTPSVQPPHQHFDPPVPFSVWVQEQLCSQQPKAEGWEPEVDYLSAPGLSPLSPLVSQHPPPQLHTRGGNGLWSNVLRVGRESRSQPWSPPHVPSHTCSFIAHRDTCSTKDPRRPEYPWQHMSKANWALLTQLSPAGQEVSAASRDMLCSQGYAMPAGDSFLLLTPLPSPLPFCPLCIISNGPEQDFLHSILHYGLEVQVSSTNPTMSKTQEHNQSTTTQLWVSHHATDTGEIGGGSTELNLSLSL